MSDDWWKSAPLADSGAAQDDSWWKSAPLYKEPEAPKPGSTWMDEGGNAYEIIEPTAKRGFGQLTPADVTARMAVKPLAQPEIAPVGPTEMAPLTDKTKAAQVAATNDPQFVFDRLNREPQNKKLVLDLLGRIRGDDRGPLETYARETGNAMLLGAPRLAMSAFSDMPIGLEHEMQKAADKRGAELNPNAARAGLASGALAQMAVVPTAAFATPGRAAVTSGLMSGINKGVETRGDLVETATAAGLGALTGYGASRALGVGPKPRAEVPTNDSLRALGNAAYKSADDAGVVFTPAALQRMRDDIRADLVNLGYHGKNQPGVKVALKELGRLENENVTLKGMDTLRQLAAGGYNPLNKKNNQMLRLFTERLDDTVANPRSGEVLMGDARRGADALKSARDYWHRMSKDEEVQYLLDKAKRRADSTGIGGNVDNTQRQNLRTLLDKKGGPRGYTGDEIEALNRAASGTRMQNIGRTVGRLSPTANGLMTAFGSALAGGAAAGVLTPWALIAPAAGFAAKTYADRASTANVEALQRLIRAGGSREALALLAKDAPRPMLDRQRAAAIHALGVRPTSQALLGQ